MSQKSGKKKSKKAAKSAAQPSVLGNLPSTRATRLGGSRETAATGRTKAATPRARPKAAAPSKPAPKAATARSRPKAAAAPTEPRTVPEADRDGRSSGPPTGVELVTTAARAAGELTQIGFTVGRQMLKRAAGRLPRR
jgi:hypothetical protein